MNIPSVYDPKQVEEKWYEHWEKEGFFHSEPDQREAYSIVIPPPNVTGVLHMGHMLNNTIQDVLIRRARMQGKNACWVPGTDHASIATENKVIGMLAEQGIRKEDIGREKFLEHAWEWKEKYGGIILKQLRKLGASCDWERTRFTMEEDLSQAVQETFVELYNKGLIYRGARMVNWDPERLTAVSDEEVIYEEVESKLYHVRYPIQGTDEFVTIATTRPETILADTAICVNPEDERYQHLIGKTAVVPMVNREIPIIADEYVTMEFGTGCLKVTPAHDENDYNLGIKHNLEVIDIIDDHGKLNEKAGFFIGEDRFDARDLMAKELDKLGLLAKVEGYQNKVGLSERSKAVIEPKLSTQWFCKMKDLAGPALESVLSGDIQFHPKKFENVYRHWLENVQDWCISRQLWWGQQIPAYYAPDGSYAVALTAEEALTKLQEKNPELTLDQIRQDDDVVDTWFSSWLWPISVFDGFKDPNNADYNYYYPTSTLVTGHDIIFFWVARMIMAGIEFKGKIPFKDVYFTGMVRDKQRRKMSKSLGNSPDALELIEKYGADGVRVGLLMSSPAGGDLLFDNSLCEQGSKFANKIWNALRLIRGWEVTDEREQSVAVKQANEWFDSRFNEVLNEVNQQFDQFRLSEALTAIYRLIWTDFCSWYLECIKPGYQQPIDRASYNQAIEQLEKCMRLLHPFMPFLTEEVWHQITDRENQDCVVINAWPEAGPVNEELNKHFAAMTDVTSEIRTFRKKQNLASHKPLSLFVKADKLPEVNELLAKLNNLETMEAQSESPEKAFTFVSGALEYAIPMEGAVDLEAELAKIESELGYARGFLKSVEKKLSNERFVQNAPEQVVASERKKQADAQAKIEALEAQMASLKK
ncbi:valine--tRNA ligase [bacterium SCSIO 12741]|nr:valine--tRNA ligase [bacterium SCSIO 12741]